MRVRLDYGADVLDVDLPDERVTVIQPVFRAARPAPHEALVAALRAPVARPPLREIVRASQKDAISVCDITRAQPRREMLRALFEEMPAVRDEDVTILIATGTHRVNTPAELEQMVGADILRRYRVVNHDSRDQASLVSVGDTRTGVPVYLHRRWVDADVRITTGFVEPHFFAGFSGGPKMVAPGLAGLATVLVLHDAQRIGHPNATWGITEGNPIHDDVREIARMTGVHFSVDVTLNRQQRITAPGYSAPDQWQVQIQAQIQMKARVMIKTGCLTPAAVRAAHLEPIDDVAAAVDCVMRAAGPDARLCVLPQGPQTIPYLSAS